MKLAWLKVNLNDIIISKFLINYFIDYYHFYFNKTNQKYLS